MYETKDERIYSGAWNLSSNSTVSFATIDIGKFADIAYYSVYARKVPTAYNDADCEKEYSGHRHLVYKYREAYGEQREVDLTDERILRDHEMMQYQKLYGNSKQLPLELWTTDSDFDKYHLRRTCLTFDEFADGPFEVKRRMNTLANASNDNYVVDVYANSNLGSAVEIHVVQVRMIEYRYNKETGGFVKVN